MDTIITKPSMDSSIIELGESSNNNDLVPSAFVCEICVESKAASEAFGIKNCSHAYCKDCMVSYVASKLQENITSIRCPSPDCLSGLLDPEHCRSILPLKAFERWGNALREVAIIATGKYFYCPYKTCSALLLVDEVNGEVVTQSKCCKCKRALCAQCKAPWHEEIDCAEFRKLNKNEREKDDIKLRKLAQKANWMRCPACGFFVERTQGCSAMGCRCGVSFCYSCGKRFFDCRCGINSCCMPLMWFICCCGCFGTCR